MPSRIVATTLLSILALCGCQAQDTNLDRVAQTSVLPDVYCMIEKLRGFAEGRALTYVVQDLSAGTAHSLSYIHGSRYFTWWILQKPDGKVSITDSSGVENSHPEQLPGVRKRLLEVEGALRGQCRLGVVMDSARESCSGPACRALRPDG